MCDQHRVRATSASTREIRAKNSVAAYIFDHNISVKCEQFDIFFFTFVFVCRRRKKSKAKTLKVQEPRLFASFTFIERHTQTSCQCIGYIRATLAIFQMFSDS